MLSTYIEDKKDWEKYVKSGKVKGYSIEGNFALVEEINEKLTRASNVVILVDENTLTNKNVQSYLNIKETQSRIVVLADRPISKQFIRNQYQVNVDDIYVNNQGQDANSKLAWRGLQATELQNRYNVIQYITNDSRLANMVKQLNIKPLSPSSLRLSVEETEKLISDLINNFELSQTFDDYPKKAKENAERGIRLNEKVNNKCATQVGKVRAQQISKGEPLSIETIKRTFSYLSRAKEYYNPNDTEACGTISYLLWGGDEMKDYCERKLEQIENKTK
jgi:hypothetical protein